MVIPQPIPLVTGTRVYSRAWPYGISAVWKKTPQKIYVAASNGAEKNKPKDKYYLFEIKYSKTSLTATLIWLPLYKLTLNFYSLLLPQLPFSYSFQSLFHQTNIRDSALIRTQAFSVARSFSHGTVGTNKFKYLLGDPLSWKRVPKNYRRGTIWLSLANF